MASLLDIMSWRNISESIQKTESGIPNPLPPVFTNLKEDVMGDRTTYLTFYGQRSTAKRVEYGSPSKVRTLKQVGEQTVALLHFAEHIKFRQELQNLIIRNPNSLDVQRMAQQEIARHTRDFKTLFDNTRIACMMSMLANGKIWIDSSGNILPSSSGTSTTIDFGIPAGNQNQVSGIIGASWATTTTAIIQHIEDIKVKARRATGRELKHAFYGQNIANYIFTNATMKSYWGFNSSIYGQFQSSPGSVPNGFAGLQWHPMASGFYDDSTDTTQGFFGVDQVTFTPEIDRNVYTLFEGSMAVPKAFGISPTALDGMGNFETVYGMGGYAVPEVDPVGIKQVNFDTFLPMWKVPNDMYICDVTP